MSKNSFDDDSRVMLLPLPERSSSPGLPPPGGGSGTGGSGSGAGVVSDRGRRPWIRICIKPIFAWVA